MHFFKMHFFVSFKVCYLITLHYCTAELLLLITCVIILHSYFTLENLSFDGFCYVTCSIRSLVPSGAKIKVLSSISNVIIPHYVLLQTARALIERRVNGRSFAISVRDNQAWSDGQVICYSLFVLIFFAGDRSVDVRLQGISFGTK